MTALSSANPAPVRYPVPTSKPTYDHPPMKTRGERKWGIGKIFESLVVVVVFALTVWLIVLLLDKGLSFHWQAVIYLIVLWGILAYLAIPRLHHFLTGLYVPDYFVGRTRTGDGLLGDPINLALDGSEADIHAAMINAGWVKADEITLGSSWGIIKSSVLRKSYPEAPVSDLFLFGRRHAFAYQQEVDGNAAQRHHVRFWPVPSGWILPGGHKVDWLAAGTYDRAVGLSGFTGQITHKIDADIDVERDYIIDTVRYRDPECEVRVIEDFSTAYHHRNGGGDEVKTDGDLPVLNVTGAAERNPEVKAAVADAKESATEKLKKHRVPPLPLLVLGVIAGLQALTIIFALIGYGIDGDKFLISAQLDPAELRNLTIEVVVFLVFWALALARKQVGRIFLIISSTVSALASLYYATTVSFDLNALLSTGFAILVLWGVSSDSVRQWVSSAKVEGN